jgi:hypothetical protein
MKSKTTRKQKEEKRAADRSYRKQIRAAFLVKGIKCRTTYLDDVEYATTRKLQERAGIEGFSARVKLKQLAVAEAKRLTAIAGEQTSATAGAQLFFPDVNASK